jgi:arylsulfatase A-like enzyme
MLAEYMGARGYATAGLVSNMYCSYDTGLDRGFTYFEDYMLEGLAFLRTSAIVEEVVKNTVLLGLHHSSGALNAMQTRLRSIFSYAVRRDARSINQGFLQWLDRRTEPGRPFFVFLNYLDAHTPYKVPSDQSRRFGRKPQTDEEVWVVYDEWTTLDKQYVPRPYLTMARDCYDSCLAYIDKEIGRLCDDLERRGMLETTWIVITSDHGEGLGEHDLYDHGESLFSTETHVPLLIIPPLSTKTKPRKIEQVVSLRDLPATIVDLAGLNDRSQFPGHSLSPLWADSRQGSAVVVSIGFSELANPSPVNASHGRSPAYRGPLVSLADDDLLYIRNERDGAEELYNERNDPGELTNLARDNSMAPAVKRFRDYLARIKR